MFFVSNYRLTVFSGCALVLFALTPAIAFAGMPSIQLHDIAKLRLEVISFFGVGLLLSAGVVKIVWNRFRQDFEWLPRLSFSRACGIVVLWGLLFVVVLTMISGARELMTPGAWEQDGITYKLSNHDEQVAEQDEKNQIPREFEQRTDRLQKLYIALLKYSATHEGRFPLADEFASVAGEFATLPGNAGMPVVYLPGRITPGASRLLAYEPKVYDESLALFSDGEVRSFSFEQVIALRESEGQP